MAEKNGRNLVKVPKQSVAAKIIPWTLRNSDPGFGYAGGTQDILTAFNGLHHRNWTNRYETVQDLLFNQLKILKDLKTALEQEEDEFFRMFGIVGKNKKECFKTLKQRLDDWNKAGAEVFINIAKTNNPKDNPFYEIVEYLQKKAILVSFSDKHWNEVLEAFFSVNEVKEHFTNKALEKGGVMKTLNELFESKGLKGNFATGGKSTLLAEFAVWVDEKTQKVVGSFQREKVSPELQLKLYNRIENYMKEQKDVAMPKKEKVQYELLDMMKGALNKLGIKNPVKKYILKAIPQTNVSEAYAFNPSKSQIKGFLGEVYNNAFLMYMAQDNPSTLQKITPTGPFLNDLNKELIIDTWLGNFGIQVKNYEKNKLMENGFNTRGRLGAGDFIRNTLRLGTGNTANNASVGDILLNFFAAYDYNRDYRETNPNFASGEYKKLPKAYQYWLNSRLGIEKKIKNEEIITKVFTPYAAEVLGVNRKFAGKHGTFSEQIFGNMVQEYHNTFFNISGNFIPSSVVVQAIIDSIEENDAPLSALVQSRFWSTPGKSNLLKWNPYTTNNSVVAEVFNKRQEYANATDISYSITLNVEKMVDLLVPKNL